jgi:hypothetical protein
MDEPDYDDVPMHPNCRCIIIYYDDLPWQAEIHDLLDETFGDTDPVLPTPA